MAVDIMSDEQHVLAVPGSQASHEAPEVLDRRSPSHIKEEPLATPLAASPAHVPDSETPSVVHSLSTKLEHGTYAQSPLRESSLPVPSTEMTSIEVPATKKRPAPVRHKKGTATVTKKEPAAKKRKLEGKRSNTPLSAISKSAARKTGSGKGTPLNSSPVPSTRSASAEADDDSEGDEEEGDGEDVDDDNLYCICRKPDTGTFMIGCDGKCDDWFHGKCMGITEKDKNLIDKYICPKCTKAGVGMTTWKRMCRRPGCRQAARVGKSKNRKEGSKYCSEECGVLFFRTMIAQTRDSVDQAKTRIGRRKNEANRDDDDLGARGGVLASGEVRTLLDSVSRVNDFRKLGDGVLSPPSTPERKSDKHSPKYTDQETEALIRITKSKDDARRRHQLLKDRLRFATLAKQAATRVAAEKELKPKEYCGYDPRIEWTEEQFALWRESPAGKEAFETDSLTAATATSAQPGAEDETKICDRRKCARHLEWNKLALDEIRFEMSDNSDNMRAFDREERSIKESAAMRSRSGNAEQHGSVEVHEAAVESQDANGHQMDVDMPTPPLNSQDKLLDDEGTRNDVKGDGARSAYESMEIDVES